MGLFKRNRPKGFYTRQRAETAPEGWHAVEALVEAVEKEGTSVRIGGSSTTSSDGARVYRTVTTYSFLDSDGVVRHIAAEDKLVSKDMPDVGNFVTLAYDPAEPSCVRILEDEDEHAERRLRYFLHVLDNGDEAQVIVASARPTGRVARPERDRPTQMIHYTRQGQQVENLPAPPSIANRAETILNLWVYPPGNEPFRAGCLCWDDGSAVEGANGLLYYLPEEPHKGLPLFAADLAAHRHRVLARLRPG